MGSGYTGSGHVGSGHAGSGHAGCGHAGCEHMGSGHAGCGRTGSEYTGSGHTGFSSCGTWPWLPHPQHVESSQTRDQTCVPCISRRILIDCTTREVPPFLSYTLGTVNNINFFLKQVSFNPWMRLYT